MSTSFVKAAGKIGRFVITASLSAIIVLAALATAGRELMDKAGPHFQNVAMSKEEPELVIKEYDLGPEILEALDTARSAAESHAGYQLDLWVDEVMARVDGGFLDDYFGYFNTKGRELKSLGRTIGHFFSPSSETADEALSRELGQKVSDEVLRPDDAQRRMNEIMDSTVDVYLSCLDTELQDIQEKYHVPAPAWNDYITDICGLTMDVEAKSFSASIKLAAGATFGLTVIQAGNLIFQSIAAKAGTELLMQTGAKVGTEMLLRTGAVAGAKVGGQAASGFIPVVGWVIFAGTCIWDVADYKVNADKGKAELRENIRDYLAEIKRQLMGSTPESIMGSMTDWENRVRNNIAEGAYKVRWG